MLLESQGIAVDPAPDKHEPSETLWQCVKRLLKK
jgi:hypothetical protein